MPDDFMETTTFIIIMSILSAGISWYVWEHKEGEELRRLRTLAKEQKELIREQQQLIIQYEFKKKKEDEALDRESRRLEILAKIQEKKRE
jgi:hypothetical protein